MTVLVLPNTSNGSCPHPYTYLDRRMDMVQPKVLRHAGIDAPVSSHESKMVDTRKQVTTATSSKKRTIATVTTNFESPPSPRKPIIKDPITPQSSSPKSPCRPHPDSLKHLTFLTPVPPPTRLSRAQSEPTKRTKRRSIFGNIQKSPRIEEKNEFQHQPSDLSSTSPSSERRIRQPPADLSKLLTPPRTAKFCASPHFRTLDELPAQAREDLPCLPTPLKRFFSDQGRKQDLAGAYPLNSPTSILRPSSYGQSGQTLTQSGADLERKVSWQDTPLDLESNTTLNLTQSLHHLDMDKMDLNREDSDTSTTVSTVLSTETGGSTTRHLRFDPRITVTEYEDNAPRYWITETELERYKLQAIKAAQKYMIAHPEVLANYTEARLDPVTGTMRRRALFSLFSMPCLDSEEEDEQVELQAAAATPDDLARTHVKNILLVEQNQLILNVLRLTLRGVFPEARFTVVETAEEALHAYAKTLSGMPTQDNHGFDIVVAEGRLRGLQGTPAYDSAELLKSESWPNHGPKSSPCNGLRLFDLIQRLDEEFYATNPPSSSDLQWRPLLVGVSPNPERFVKKFRNHGADFVWSLPPPKLDQAHRDEMVSVLVKKRSQHA